MLACVCLISLLQFSKNRIFISNGIDDCFELKRVKNLEQLEIELILLIYSTTKCIHLPNFCCCKYKFMESCKKVTVKVIEYAHEIDLLLLLNRKQVGF